MADQYFQIYEAIVVNSAPDPALPGHITVRIPDLFGENELPEPIPPLFPGGGSGGAWMSVPSAVPPEVDTDMVDENRIVVVRLSRETFRYLGTTEEWSRLVGDHAGKRAGARTPNGRVEVYIDDDGGFFAVVSSSADPDGAKSFINAGRDGRIQIATSDGTSIMMTEKQIVLINKSGDTITLDEDNGIVIMHHEGTASISMTAGGIIAVNGATVQVSGGTIELGGGTLAPLHKYILSIPFFTDLAVVMAEIAAIGAGIPLMLPVPTPGAIAMAASLPASLASGPPYLSTRITGD